MTDHRYLIEFIQLGNAVKVSAIDPVSLTEVSIMGAPSMNREQLKRLAVKKLEYIIEKKKKK